MFHCVMYAFVDGLQVMLYFTRIIRQNISLKRKFLVHQRDSDINEGSDFFSSNFNMLRDKNDQKDIHI